VTVQKLSSSSGQRRKAIKFQFSEGGNLIILCNQHSQMGFTMETFRCINEEALPNITP